MGNRHFNGTAAVFRIWEPREGRAPGLVPVTLGLHAGGGAFCNITPAFSTGEPTSFHLTDGLLIAPDDSVLIRRAESVLPERTFWFGYGSRGAGRSGYLHHRSDGSGSGSRPQRG